MLRTADSNDEYISAYTMRTYTAGASSVFSSRLSNEFRLNYSSNETTSVTLSLMRSGAARLSDLQQLAGLGAGSEPSVALTMADMQLSLDQAQQSGAQRQWNLVDTVSLSWGVTSSNLVWTIAGWRRLPRIRHPVCRVLITLVNLQFRRTMAFIRFERLCSRLPAIHELLGVCPG